MPTGATAENTTDSKPDIKRTNTQLSSLESKEKGKKNNNQNLAPFTLHTKAKPVQITASTELSILTTFNLSDKFLVYKWFVFWFLCLCVCVCVVNGVSLFDCSLFFSIMH